MDFITIKTEVHNRKIYIKPNTDNPNPYFQLIAKTDYDNLDESSDVGHIFTVKAIPGTGKTILNVYNNLFEGFFGSTGTLIPVNSSTTFEGEVAGVTTFLSANDTDPITFERTGGGSYYISIGDDKNLLYLTFDSRDNSTKWLKMDAKTQTYQYFYPKWIVTKAETDPIPPNPNSI